MRGVSVLALSAAVLPCALFASESVWSALPSADFSRIVLSGEASPTNNVRCRWIVLRNGQSAAAGEFPVEAFKTRPVATNSVPPMVGELASRGGQISLRVKFARHIVDSEGEVTRVPLSESQIDFPVKCLPSLPPCDALPEVTTNGGHVVFQTKNVAYTFDLAQGELLGIRTLGWSDVEWLADVNALASSNRRPHDKVLRILPPVARTGEVAFAVLRRCATDRGECDLALEWTVRGDGALLLRGEARSIDGLPLGNVPGLRLPIKPSDLLVEWLGEGPGEDRDGKIGESTFVQLWHAPLRKLMFDRGGRRARVQALSLDAGSHHLSVAGDAAGFTMTVASGSVLDLRRPAGTNDLVRPLTFVIRPEKAYSALTVPSVRLIPSDTAMRRWRAKAPGVTFIDLKHTVTAKGLRVRGGHGTFSVETSVDGAKWTREVEGALAPEARFYEFKSPVTARHVRIETKAADKDTQAAGEAEIEVVTE